MSASVKVNTAAGDFSRGFTATDDATHGSRLARNVETSSRPREDT